MNKAAFEALLDYFNSNQEVTVDDLLDAFYHMEKYEWDTDGVIDEVVKSLSITK